MDEKQQARRVLNLISRVNVYTVTEPKKWAVLKLLKWQPLAKRIRFGEKCHCKFFRLITYQLDGIDYDRDEHSETCGYYCPACGFGNAGSREKVVR